MRGGEGAADWEMTDFGSARLGVTYALADQRSTIGYVSPYSSQDTQASFRQRGSTPDLIFDPDRATDTSAMLTLRDGDHISGWRLDATGYDNALLLDQTGDYYVTDTVISNAEESGTLIDGQTGTTPVLHVSNSTLNNNAQSNSSVYVIVRVPDPPNDSNTDLIESPIRN